MRKQKMIWLIAGMLACALIAGCGNSKTVPAPSVSVAPATPSPIASLKPTATLASQSMQAVATSAVPTLSLGESATLAPTAATETWSISVHGAQRRTFSDLDYSKLDAQVIQLQSTNASGIEQLQSYSGISMQDFLTYVQAPENCHITLIASDGYKLSIDSQQLPENAILAAQMDGQTLDVLNYPIIFLLPDQPESLWVRGLKRVVIVG